MSFSATAFKFKLDTLLDTQESIVSISQWVLFHQKYYKRVQRFGSTTSLKIQSHQPKDCRYFIFAMTLCNKQEEKQAGIHQ